MPVYRCDLLFNMVANGWSEKYYFNSTTAATAGTKALNLATKRTPLLNRNAKVYGWRIQQYAEDTGLPAFKSFFTSARSQGIGGNSAGTKDQQNVSLLVRYGNPTVAAGAKMMWMRGFPDSSADWDNEGNPNFTNAFDTPWQSLVAYVKTAEHQMRLFDIADGSNPKFTITSFTFNPDGFLLLTLSAADDTLKAGTRVRVFKYRGDATVCVNGTKKIKSRPSTTTMLLDYKDKDLVGQTFEGDGAYLRKEKFSFIPVTTMDAVDWSTHQTGRPFGSGVGRRKRTC